MRNEGTQSPLEALVTPSLPGTIPELLQTGCPVIDMDGKDSSNRHGVVIHPDPSKERPRIAVFMLSGEYRDASHPCHYHLNLGCEAGVDRAARWLAAHLFPAATIEGVMWHRSWRGYYELHVWIRGESGRAREISFGDRFTDRNEDREHGVEAARGVCVESVDDPAEALRRAVLYVSERG